MLKKQSDERIICCKCRKRNAVDDFDSEPVCAQCRNSTERTLSSVASTGDIHGIPRPDKQTGP
jgi:uncharacterized CHY-type Zn-finger protein